MAQRQSAHDLWHDGTLLAHFDFNDGDGSAVLDRTANENHGALSELALFAWEESDAPAGNAVTTPEDVGILIQLNGSSVISLDETADVALEARVTSLPAAGTLYHVNSGWTQA